MFVYFVSYRDDLGSDMMVLKTDEASKMDLKCYYQYDDSHVSRDFP